MNARAAGIALLMLASVMSIAPGHAEPDADDVAELGTCGPSTHPAVPVAVIPGQTGNYAIIYQFQGLSAGSVYASWRMESNTGSNEFEDWGIVFGAYETSAGGYEAGAGQTGNTSGSCLYLGSMPTSRWYIDVFGGGGGFVTSNSCTVETWWEVEVGGKVGFEFGSGFELEANGHVAWGGSDSCTNGAEYDSGALLTVSSWSITGPCIECLLEIPITVSVQASATALQLSPSLPITPTVDFVHCGIPGASVLVPVTEKMVDSEGTGWQFFQVFDALDDTTPVYAFYENAPGDDLFFGGTMANVNDPTKDWFSWGHQSTAAAGCLPGGNEAVFGFFDFDVLAAHGSGDCVAHAGYYTSSGPGDTRGKEDRLYIGLEDPNDPFWVKIPYQGSDSCSIDTYSSSVSLNQDGAAGIVSEALQ